MKKVCVYFHDKQLYNLEDMSILDTFPNRQQKTLYKHLEILKKKYLIKLAIISFNQPLREIVYSLFPGAMIIINPKDVLDMMNSHLGDVATTLKGDKGEEVAVTLEEDRLFAFENPITCQSIYSCYTKQEAMFYYRKWQSHVPLGIKSFHHVIRKIDFYYDEVFNYFDFKNFVIKLREE